MLNIKKFQKSNKRLVSEDDFTLIKDDIRKLRFSTSEEEWNTDKKEFEKRWADQFPEMYNYIEKQWFNSEFSNWQVYINLHWDLQVSIQIWRVLILILKHFLLSEKDYQ